MPKTIKQEKGKIASADPYPNKECHNCREGAWTAGNSFLSTVLHSVNTLIRSTSKSTRVLNSNATSRGRFHDKKYICTIDLLLP